MAVAREFGLDQGFLVPIVRSAGFQACVTMAGERPDYDPRAKRALHLVCFKRTSARCSGVGSGRQIQLGNCDHPRPQRAHRELACGAVEEEIGCRDAIAGRDKGASVGRDLSRQLPVLTVV
jgi:hypothetical protein